METQTKSSTSLLHSVQEEIKFVLRGGHAHATFDDAVKNFPVDQRGIVPDGLPYSAWQIVEHIRIAQEDMLHFSNHTEKAYKEKKWPDDYWPENPEPPNAKAWDDTIHAIHADRQTFEKLVEKATEESLGKSFSWGDGQSLLREALQIADHNAYHVGELIVLRRLLGIWKK